MIRDDFKNVKQVTKKENRKKKAMGERAFYAKQLPKLRDLTRAMTFSTVFTLICMALVYALVLLLFIFGKDYALYKFIIWSCVFGAVAVFALIWFLFLRPANFRKIERYKKELEALNYASLNKMAGVYKIYGEDYKNAVYKPENGEENESRENGQKTEEDE